MSSIQEHSARARIVVVDSEPTSSRQTVATLTAAGYECKSFGEPDAAVATLNESGADIMLVDFSSEKSAAELLRRVRVQSPKTAVVLTVPNPIVSSAVAAMRHGAFDYLTRPINGEELTAVIGKALEMASLRRENRLLHEQLDVASMAAAFIAESAASRNLAAMVRRAAPANSPVLIEGESGTGKELVARMLHHWSSRAQGPFVKVNFKSLAPMPSSSGMAGDAMRPHFGIAAMLSEYIERAAGGTLFLDEISEATPDFQSALLRLTGEGERPRTNGRTGVSSGARIVASTSRHFTHEVAGGRIRPDLYFALNVIAIQVAPLRERREDILPLARHFLALHAAESGRALMLTADAEKALLAYSWPGNVRELENIIERAVVMSTSERISPEALMIPGATISIAEPSASNVPVVAESPDDAVQAADQMAETARGTETEALASQETATASPVVAEGTLQEFLDRAAALRIRRAIDSAKGNRNAAATALGIDRTTLYRLMRKLGI